MVKVKNLKFKRENNKIFEIEIQDVINHVIDVHYKFEKVKFSEEGFAYFFQLYYQDGNIEYFKASSITENKINLGYLIQLVKSKNLM